MINITTLFRSLKLDLGIHGIALPFENPDDFFKEILELKTLPAFSQYQPYYFTFNTKQNELREVEKRNDYVVYEIPDIFGDREILLVRDIEFDTSTSYSNYYDPYMGGMCMSFEDIIMTQATANLTSAIAPAITYEFIPPNKIKIYNLMYSYHTNMKIELGLTHSPNLSTIPNTSYQSFYKLFSLDVKAVLYNNLKHYNELSTAYGNINLRIDDWSNAESERDELLNQWSDVYHLDVEQFIII